jgi:kynurenine formamidase
MMPDSELPSYRELPELPNGVRSGWGLFGDEDSVGLMNLLTPERIVAAAGLVRKGAVFRLDLPIGAVTPPPFGRGAARHTVLERDPNGLGLDDVIDNLFPQSGSQWDALAHVAYGPDAWYNGATRQQVKSGERNTIDFWAARGIVARGVVIDVSAAAEAKGGHGEAPAITPDDIEAARVAQGVEVRPGDILVLRTGFLTWYRAQSLEVREGISGRSGMRLTGIDHGEAMAEYLWDLHISAVVADSFGLEVFPWDRDDPFGFLHPIIIGQFGMGVGELWDLDALAADCAADSVWECFLMSAPLYIPGGIGSPANAIAIK